MATRLLGHKATDGLEASADAGSSRRTCCGCRSPAKRQDVRSNAADDGLNDTGILGAGTGRSASAASKVVARTDCCLTLLAVWMLVVQLLFLAIAVAVELPYISAENMYNGYICMVAILNLVLFSVIVFGLRKADGLMSGLQAYHGGAAMKLRADLALQRAIARGLDGTAAAVVAAEELSPKCCRWGRPNAAAAALALANKRVAHVASQANDVDEQSDDEDGNLFTAAARFGAGTVVAAANTVGKTGVAGVKLLGWATGLAPKSGGGNAITLSSALNSSGQLAGRWQAAGGLAPAPPAADAAAALCSSEQRAAALTIQDQETMHSRLDAQALPQVSQEPLPAALGVSSASVAAILRSQPPTSLLAGARMPADAAASRGVAAQMQAQLEALYPLLTIGDRTAALLPAPVPSLGGLASPPLVAAAALPSALSHPVAHSLRQSLLASDSLTFSLAHSSGYSFDEMEPRVSSRPSSVTLSRAGSSSSVGAGARAGAGQGKPSSASVLAVTRADDEEGVPLAEALAALRAVHAANGVFTGSGAGPSDAGVGSGSGFPSSPQRSRNRGREETRRDASKRVNSASRSRSHSRRRDASAERYRLLHGVAGDAIDTSLMMLDPDEESSSSLQLATISSARGPTAAATMRDATSSRYAEAVQQLPHVAPALHAAKAGGAGAGTTFVSPPSLRDGPHGPDKLHASADKRSEALRSLSLQLRIRQHEAASRMLFGWRLELLLLCAVTGILFGIKAVMFLWRPISGTSIDGLAGVVLYPFFFYTVPECVPALLCALAAAGLPIHVVARAVFGVPFRLLHYLICCRCCRCCPCARRASSAAVEEANAAAAIEVLSSRVSSGSGLSDPLGVLSCTEPSILAAFAEAAGEPTADSAQAFLTSLAMQSGVALPHAIAVKKREKADSSFRTADADAGDYGAW